MKRIEIDPAKKDDETYFFIQEGEFFLGAAQHLFICNSVHLNFLFPACFLGYQGIELILKAFMIWENSEFFITHDLMKIAKEIKVLNISKEEKNLLDKINTYYHNRYPLDGETYNKIANTLENIKDETIPGRINLPYEIGTVDWQNIKKFHNCLVKKMPDELIVIYNKIGTYVLD